MNKKLRHVLYATLLLPTAVWAQGLQNKGAHIVLANSAQVYVDGGTNGSVVNSDAGEIHLDGTLILEGNFTNNATNDAFNTPNTDGEVVFAGGTQNIGGSYTDVYTFENVTVNNGADVTLTGGKQATIKGDFTNNGTFTLATGATSLLTEGSVSGSGTSKQVLHLENAQQYYYVSSSIPDVTSEAFGGTAELSGTETTDRKLYKFNGLAWQRIQSGGETFAAGNGYAFKPETANSDWTLSGSSYNNGSVSVNTLNFNGSNFHGSADDYTLLGNPYPSALDLGAANGWTLNSCGGDFYHRAAGNFVTYNVAGGVQTPIEATAGFNARYLAPMQAVWVEATSSSASLLVDNQARVHNSQSVHKNNVLLNGLYLGINTADQTLVAFNSEAGNGYDRYDSRKMIFDGASQIYTIGANNLAINTFTSIDKNMSIPVGVKINTNGAQQINVLFGDAFDASVSVYLEDKLTGTMHNLRSGAYSFDATEGTANNRFVLHFTNSTTGVTDAATNSVNVYAYGKMAYISSNVAGNAQVFDVSGRLVASKNLSGFQNLTGLHIALTGVYVVKVSTANGITTHKIVIE